MYKFPLWHLHFGQMILHPDSSLIFLLELPGSCMAVDAMSPYNLVYATKFPFFCEMQLQ